MTIVVLCWLLSSSVTAAGVTSLAAKSKGIMKALSRMKCDLFWLCSKMNEQAMVLWLVSYVLLDMQF